MNKKFIRVLSIVALVFMGIFTVALIAFFSTASWPGGESSDLSVIFSIILAVSGVIGIALFFAVKLLTREPKKMPAPQEDEGAGAQEDETEREGDSKEESQSSAETKP